jgi:glucose-6-phosphate isomerase
MWDWVGGRFSVWSAVGLAAACAMGPDRFGQFLAGGREIDLHFASAEPEKNLPVLMALIGAWNVNFLGCATHAVLPYSNGLRLLPAYLQQLEMESNGKRVTVEGEAVDFQTCPVIWGGTETPGQHAFHQWLHQGTDKASCDFIVVARAMGRERAHHEMLLANACAQSQALMTGVAADEPWRACPGDRVSTTFVLPELDAFHLGALLAIYEHKVFAQGVIWGIDSFDQWGVELGKTIAGRILPAVRGGEAALHPATHHLLGIIRRSSRP